jgi:hypothetical protein
LETTFNQDLNGDGIIGSPPATQLAKAQVAGADGSRSTAAHPECVGSSLPDNFNFLDESSNGTPVQASAFLTSGSPAQTSAVTIAGGDVFVFAPNFGQVSIANFAPSTDTIQFSKTVFANIQALLAATHDDVSGNAVITDAAHDTITLKHVTTAQLLTHQSDFHFI